MLATGTILFDRYRIDELLGSGGMGAVYRAFDLRLQCSVAVKENLVMVGPDSAPPDAEALARSREQFEREAQVLARLDHPGLPKVIEHFVIPGQGQYLVMSFVKGLDLQTMVRMQGRLPEELVVRLGVEGCDILKYLHSRTPPVIHRDIKPANLRLNEEGRLVFVDFGLVKGSFGATATTQGARGVSPGFSPLEQYEGSARTDARSDIYSLGATLFALLTGETPPTATDRAVGAPTQLRPARVEMSLAIRNVIEKAMAVKQIDRHQGAEELKKALQLLNLDRSEQHDELGAIQYIGTPTRILLPASATKSNEAGAKSRLKVPRLLYLTIGGVAVVAALILAMSRDRAPNNTDKVASTRLLDATVPVIQQALPTTTGETVDPNSEQRREGNAGATRAQAPERIPRPRPELKGKTANPESGPISHHSTPGMADHPAPPSSFIRSLGGVRPTTVRQLGDGGYLVGSNIPPERAILSRMNESGTLLWSMDLEIDDDLERKVALAESPNGSALVGVGDEDVRILNLSKDGAIVWQTRVPWPARHGESVITLLPLNAGGLIFVGTADSANRGNGFCGWRTLFLGRLSESGKKIWTRTYAALSSQPTLAVGRSSDDRLVIGYDMEWKDDRLDRCVTRPDVIGVDLEGNVERLFVPQVEPGSDTQGAIAIFASPDGTAWLLGDTRFRLGQELGAFVAHGSIASEASVQPLDLSATQEDPGHRVWAKGIINAVRQGERTIVLSWSERRRKHGPNVRNNNTYWLTSFDRAFRVMWTVELTAIEYEAKYENLAPTSDGGTVLIGTRPVEGRKHEGFLEKRTAHGTR